MGWLQRLLGRDPDADADIRYRILIVCRANITRSPFLAALLRLRLQERLPLLAEHVRIASAGVEARTGSGPDLVMHYVAQQQGVDLRGHRSQPVTAKLLKQTDRVLTLEAEFAERIENEFPEGDGKCMPLLRFGRRGDELESWDVPDPTGRDNDQYEAFLQLALSEVERILDVLIPELQGQRGNIVLIGMPGAGKSHLGEALADALQLQFIDTDRRIEERVGRPLQDIVDDQGVGELRAQEEEAILDLDPLAAVISTGGSAVYSDAAMAHLRKLGHVVYLKIRPETVQERVGSGEGRGLAKRPEQSLLDLYEERRPLYERWAEWTLENDQDPDKSLQRLVKRFDPM